MPKSLTQEEAYDRCAAEGTILAQELTDTKKIGSMTEIIKDDLKTIDELKKKGERYNTIYKLSYDALHTLSEAFISFDKIKCKTHQSLFAYLCVKHPELEFHWNFFEKIRTKRNGIQYYGTGVSKEDWKEVELQFMLYIKKLKEEIEKRI